MLAIYAASALIIAASLLAGETVLTLLRWKGSRWLAGATGFAALVVVATFAVRLPGRALTAAIVVGALLAACAWIVVRDRERERGVWWAGAVAAILVIAAASIPFALNDRVGVLGEGIYTNDHAAQLYWTAWLRDGFGPEPSAVAWGYPIGPQALVAIVAEVTHVSLVSAFNGLLLAIVALTALGSGPKPCWSQSVQ